MIAAEGADSMHEALKDGQYLCKLINAISPGSCKPNSSKMAFKQMENIGFFLLAAENYGVTKSDLFQTVDLYEKQNMSQVLFALASLGQQLKPHPKPI